MIPKDLSIYEGIVIQNNDPETMGRVKIFVPGISNTVYDNWNATAIDKEFSGIDGDLIPILNQLRDDLPWANRAATFFGGDSDHLTFNEAQRLVERPSDSLVQSPPKDAFDNANYTPSDYSEACAGIFSIPSVGSHVYVFFKFGNTNYPVYFAAAHSKCDWEGIFKDNYPNDYENEKGTGDAYQNKHVLNSTKHSFEMIDSDGIEVINLSHFSGSNIQFLNDYVSKYCVNDDYTLIENNKYETVKKNETVNIGENETVTIGGTQNITVQGTQDVTINSDQSITVNGNITMKASGSITIESAGGKIVLDASGVTVTGAAINLN